MVAGMMYSSSLATLPPSSLYIKLLKLWLAEDLESEYGIFCHSVKVENSQLVVRRLLLHMTTQTASTYLTFPNPYHPTHFIKSLNPTSVLLLLNDNNQILPCLLASFSFSSTLKISVNPTCPLLLLLPPLTTYSALPNNPGSHTQKQGNMTEAQADVNTTPVHPDINTLTNGGSSRFSLGTIARISSSRRVERSPTSSYTGPMSDIRKTSRMSPRI